MILVLLTYIAMNVILAGVHARMIKEQEKIRHGLWAALVILVAGVFCLLAYLRGWTFWHTILFGIDLLSARMVFFNLPLNVFRGKPLLYVTPEVKGINLRQAWNRGKTIDWLHYQITGDDPEIHYTVYMIAVIGITVYLLNHYPALGININ